jgi:hypothetical protein
MTLWRLWLKHGVEGLPWNQPASAHANRWQFPALDTLRYAIRCDAQLCGYFSRGVVLRLL